MTFLFWFLLIVFIAGITIGRFLPVWIGLPLQAMAFGIFTWVAWRYA